jgi:hypothetical protein
MFNGRKRDQAAAEALAERRRREDAAPRLLERAPQLRSLRLWFEEGRAGGGVLALPYSRPIVVASAPAQFDVPCMEPRCDGRHDLTSAILRALDQRLTNYEGESVCNGVVNLVGCDRTLKYRCEATYAAG